ncbi:YcjX family protein [Neiella marina]|uniref:YcjX family protein n=1 Tax=Neiella holothuriorum TaxID=2870530 RepID=A0ABS7EDF8_9GAMM|nr:YcjX family protein [Neiella holothuriorum]MBW8190369.1 YcjX family protein [Neiella holothuriorum]
MELKRTVKQAIHSANTLIERARSQHLTLAVTGLSRSGKTAFITSLVNQLQQGNTPEHLPLFDVVRERRLKHVRQVAQPHLNVASFRYLAGMRNLTATPPKWPEPTKTISEIRLELTFKAKSNRWLSGSEPSKLLLDIIDYPGEWLLDLPMLNLDFQQWSEQQWHLLEQPPRKDASADWRQQALALLGREPCDDAIHECADHYAKLLKEFKQTLGLSLLQPGRMLMPGDMEGTPALAFFPLPEQCLLDDAASKALWHILKARYDYYVKHVVKAFFKRYFSHFDRQVVLVDCLQPLNEGEAHFREMQQAIGQVMNSFQYGEQSWWQQLFDPKIDRLLIAATKADHVTIEQFEPLTNLVEQITEDARRYASFSDIKIQSQALASIRATKFGHVQQGKKTVPALKGNRISDGQSITLFPGDVPPGLPSPAFFEQHSFNFVAFAPQPRQSDYAPLPHIGMDKAIEFLLGDVLK